MQSPSPKTPKKSARKRKNTKLTGERSEAAFLARSIDFGFGIAKPWGDSRRYDFILDNGECLHRIQVKCTESIRARAYETRATYTTGKGRAVYTKKDIDFIAAHVVPLNLWYIIPVEICTPAPMLRFYPHRKARIMRLEPYREAWNLILPKESNHVMELHAFADETVYEEEEERDGLAACHSDPNRSVGEESAFADRNSSVILGSSLSSTVPDPCISPTALRKKRGKRPEKRDDHLLTLYRALCQKTPTTKVDPALAPWPIPPLKILATRKGKRILPEPPQPMSS